MTKLSIVLNQVGKTINLAKPNTYSIPRKPPLNSLIFEKLPEPRCGDKVTCGIKGPPVTKPVRVCTKEDLQAFYCPPVPCDCKMKPPPLTASQRMGLLFRQTMKALLVAGMIYYTYEEGLWSDAFRSSCFLGKFVERCPKEEEEDLDYNEFADLRYYSIEEPETCFPFIPNTGYIIYKLRYFWNQVVIYAFWMILDAPGEMWEAFLSLFRKKPKPPPPKLCIQPVAPKPPK